MSEHREVLLVLGYYDHRFHLGAARYAQEHGWHLSAGLAYGRRIPYGWEGDGILSKLTETGTMSRFVARCKKPVINVGRGIGRSMPLVLTDEEIVARMGAQHFLERGFEHFVWVGPRPGHPESTPRTLRSLDRAQLFRYELQKAGRSCAILDWNTARGERPDRWSSRHTWYSAHLRELPKPLAVFCWSDVVASELVLICRDIGLSIPDQVAILGVNNDALVCQAVPIPLSSIDTDMEGRAYQAAALLDQLMGGEKKVPRHTLVPPRALITRASSDILAIEHEPTARALRYINDHISARISVNLVAEVAGISTRGLHKAFVQHLGRTPIEEITRVRLQRAQELLRDGEDKLSVIARKSGFASGRNLFRVFHSAFKETPTAYRARLRRNI